MPPPELLLKVLLVMVNAALPLVPCASLRMPPPPVAPELPLKVLLVTIRVTEGVVDAAAAAAGRVAA